MTGRNAGGGDEHAHLPKGDVDEDGVLSRSKLGVAEDSDIAGATEEHAISDTKLGGHKHDDDRDVPHRRFGKDRLKPM
jgi:hypothetical protein